MKILQNKADQTGFLMTEVIVAIAILTLASIPLAMAFYKDQKLCRIYYYRAVAMEVVDGEMEILRAGAWKQVEEGTHSFQVHAEAANSLRSGKFLVTRSQNHLRLEWQPDKKQGGGPFSREMEIK